MENCKYAYVLNEWKSEKDIRLYKIVLVKVSMALIIWCKVVKQVIIKFNNIYKDLKWYIYINKSNPLRKFSAKLIKSRRAFGWARGIPLLEPKDTAFRRS